MPINPQPRKLPQLAQAIRSIPGALLVLLALLAIVPRASAAILTNNNTANTNWSGAGAGQMFNVNPANNATNTFVFATTAAQPQATNNQDRLFAIFSGWVGV